MKPTKHATTNYRMLKPLIDGMSAHGENNHYRKYESDGFMPLVIEAISADENGRTVFSLTHYGEQNGDLMADPDMMIKVDHAAGTVEPLTFQNDYMGIYQQVYIERDGKRLYSPRLRTSLDDFLWHWLKNIEMQGYLENSQKGA